MTEYLYYVDDCARIQIMNIKCVKQFPYPEEVGDKVFPQHGAPWVLARSGAAP